MSWFYRLISKFIKPIEPMQLITAEQLKAITSLNKERCDELAEMLNQKQSNTG